MAVSLEEKLQAYADAGHRVSTGYGESPESVARRQQSLAIAQLKDAQAAADDALRSGQYRAYVEAEQKKNDSLMKYMADVARSGNSARAQVLAKKVGEIGKISDRLIGQMSSDAFDALSRLKAKNLGRPGEDGLDQVGMLMSIQDEVMKFPPTPQGLNDARSLLRMVGKEMSKPVSIEEIEQALIARTQGSDDALNRRLQAAEHAEGRLNNDLNSERTLRSEWIQETRKGFMGAGGFKRLFEGTSMPTAAALKDPDALQAAYEAEVPEGSRSKEFEIAERERQLGGTMSQTLRDVLKDGEFKAMASQLGLETPGELNQFANAMIRGPRATERFINRYMDRPRSGTPSPRGDGIAKVGRWQGSGYAEDDDVLFGSVKEREAADKEQLAKIKAAEEETDLGGEESIRETGQGMLNIVNHFKKKGLGPDKIPPHWLERARRKIAEQRHIRQQEGGDAAEIERLSNMVSYIERLEEHIKGAPERAEPEALDEQIAGLAVPKGPIDFPSASAKKVLDDLRAEKEGANAGKETAVPSDGHTQGGPRGMSPKEQLRLLREWKKRTGGVKTPPDEVEEVSAQEEVVAEPAPSAEAVAPRTLASKEQYEAAGLKPPRRYKKLLGQLREGR